MIVLAPKIICDHCESELDFTLSHIVQIVNGMECGVVQSVIRYANSHCGWRVSGYDAIATSVLFSGVHVSLDADKVRTIELSATCVRCLRAEQVAATRSFETVATENPEDDGG